MRILNSSLKAGSFELKNRLVMPPMQTCSCTDEGHITDKVIKYYDERTKSGDIGLVIVEHSYVSPEGKACKGQISVSNDSDICGLSRLAECINKNGSKSCIQLTHAGGSACLTEIVGSAIGPSDVECIRTGVVPVPMTKDDILRVEDDFATAALRAKKAGFDAVELHSAHGYLLNQFLSPYSNHRKDEYGGSLENRIRIHIETLQKVRNVVGTDFTIILRLGAKDYYVDGTNLEDSIYAAKEFEKYGVDILDISGGMSIWSNPNNSAPGFFAELSTPIRKAVNIPVILTGGVKTGNDAETLLQNGAADLIGVGRPIFADPAWASREMHI